MSASVRYVGLDDLIQQLQNLPRDLSDDAGRIVVRAAESARDDAYRNYPERTGNLRDGLAVIVDDVGQFGTRARVVNRSKVAHLFESGTQSRQNSLGANRGSMPVGNVFVPSMIRNRRPMYDDLKQMLRDHGASEVSGDA